MLNGTGPAQDRHQDRNGAGTAWYSVPAAAVLLGIHERAVRKRIAAGTVTAERTAEGWRVQVTSVPGPAPGPELDPESSGPGAGTPEPRAGPGPEPVVPSTAAPLVDQLQSEVTFLRAELAERNAHLSACRERLREAHVLPAQRPALPPASEVSDMPSPSSPPWWSWQRWAWWRR